MLTDAPPDYSARAEAKLLRGGRSGLDVVFRSPHITIYELPHASPIVTGPAPARVVELAQARAAIEVSAPGVYRVAIRYSPYWSASVGCLDAGKDSLIRLRAPAAGRIELLFHVNARRAFAAFAGEQPQGCRG